MRSEKASTELASKCSDHNGESIAPGKPYKHYQYYRIKACIADSPVLSSPRSVERPERVKYCHICASDFEKHGPRWMYQWKEDDGNHVLQLFRNNDGKATFARYNYACNKGAYSGLSIQVQFRRKRQVPKMACTPMTSVKKADPNTMSIVTVIKKTVGPLSTVENHELSAHISTI